MRLEFDKVGKGCNVCMAKSKEACRVCERNPALHTLVDNFKPFPKKPPEPPLKDDRPKIPEKNRAELARWGIHVAPEPRSDQFSPAAPTVEESASPSPPPEGLDP